jgi:hypothetical protein
MDNLFQELKRRKVLRVTAAYEVVAWLLVQIATVILPTFEVPQWVTRSIVCLLPWGSQLHWYWPGPMRGPPMITHLKLRVSWAVDMP